MNSKDGDIPYSIIEVFPNGEKPDRTHTYRDMDTAEQAIGALALAGIRSRDGYRRTFEMVLAPESPPEPIEEVVEEEIVEEAEEKEDEEEKEEVAEEPKEEEEPEDGSSGG